MESGELLKTSHVPKSEQRSFSSSKRHMRVLRPIVRPVTLLLPSSGSDFLHFSAVGTRVVRHSYLRLTVNAHCFPEDFQGCFLVGGLGCKPLGHLNLLIHGSPEAAHLAIDSHGFLVQMPTPATGSHAFSPALPHLGCKHRIKMVTPTPDRLVAHVNPPFMRRVFHTPKRKQESDKKNNRRTSEFSIRFEVLERGFLWTCADARSAPFPPHPKFL